MKTWSLIIWMTGLAVCSGADLINRLESLEKDASNGVAAAQFELGMKYASGGAKARNSTLSEEWIFRAATNGHVPAIMRMGWLSMDKDRVTALAWFQQAARSGDAEGLFQVARLFDRAEMPKTGILEGREIVKDRMPIRPEKVSGRSVAPDIAQAWSNYKLAAAKNHPGAMNNLGAILALAQGGPPDYVEAYVWFRKAADLENPVALSNLGLIEKWMTPQQIAEGKKRFALGTRKP